MPQTLLPAFLTRRLILGVVCCVALFSAFLSATYSNTALAYEPEKLEALPEAQFIDLEQNTISIGDTQGTFRVINFWATWCPPCVKEMPSLSRLHQQLVPHNAQVIAVNVGENVDQVEAFMLENDFDLQMPIWLDPEGKTFRTFKLGGLPLTYIVDQEGQIVEQVLGIREWDSKETVDALLAAAEEAAR